MSGLNDPGIPGRARRGGSVAWSRWALGALIIAHASATFVFFRPTMFGQPAILAARDYPCHARRAHVYREALRESGRPWGYDPAMSAGVVLDPARDVGSVPYQLLAVALPRADTGRLVVGYAWAVVLIAPLLLIPAARMLKLPREGTAWGLLFVLALLWFGLPYRMMLRDGMIAFLSASYLCLFVLALYQRFLATPSVRGYVTAASAGALLFMAHPWGPIPIAGALVVLVVFVPGIDWRWRLATAASPLLIVATNAFWCVPALRGVAAPPPPWSAVATHLTLPYWTWNPSTIAQYFGVGVIAAHLFALPITAYGLVCVVRRRSRITALGLGMVLATALVLFAGASFWSVGRLLQPARFVVVLWTVMALCAGCALKALFHALERRGASARVAPTAFGLAFVALLVAYLLVGPTLNNGPDAVGLYDFVNTRTQATDRLLVEAIGRYGRIAQDLPRTTGREVIGSSFPDSRDPMQFVSRRLFARDVTALSQDAARIALSQLGVNWAFVKTPAWQAFFRELTGSEGEAVGSYLAFEISRDRSRLLVGTADVRAGVNRLELRDVRPENGRVVLQYRFHPGWICDPPASLGRFPVAVDPAGLLLVRDPPPELVLRFDPVLALQRPWPVDP